MKTSEEVIGSLEIAFKEKLFELLPYILIIIVFLIIVPLVFRIIRKKYNL